MSVDVYKIFGQDEQKVKLVHNLIAERDVDAVEQEIRYEHEGDWAKLVDDGVDLVYATPSLITNQFMVHFQDHEHGGMPVTLQCDLETYENNIAHYRVKQVV